jgi:monoamine oxidase
VHVLPPGVLTEYRSAYADPCGRIHWAGTETATLWHGYMDGAVRSGERASAEVLTAGLARASVAAPADPAVPVPDGDDLPATGAEEKITVAGVATTAVGLAVRRAARRPG